jgi:hypothetical protein
MNVVWHYHVAADGDIVFGVGFFSEAEKRLIHGLGRQQFAAAIGASRDEIDRIARENAAKPGWKSGETFHCSRRPMGGVGSD